MLHLTRIFTFLTTLSIMPICSNNIDLSEPLALDIISYEAFVSEDPEALNLLKTALHEKGIAGIRGIPGYKEKVTKFIETAREFSALPEETKETYAPNRALGETFLGYERGKEKFQRPDGSWVIDDLKVSYYGLVPNHPHNKWPSEVDLQTPFQDLGVLMSQMGEAVMEKIGLIGPSTGITLGNKVGRMLYYRKSLEGASDNRSKKCIQIYSFTRGIVSLRQVNSSSDDSRAGISPGFSNENSLMNRCDRVQGWAFALRKCAASAA